MNDINPDDLNPFFIPESFLDELFELTGDSESNRGFILSCVGQDGKPFIYSKSATEVVHMGLRKSLEDFLLASSESGIVDFTEEN
jgi:hypothetical protein